MKEEESLIVEGELIYYAITLDPSLKSLEVVPTSDEHYGNPLFSKRHAMRHTKYFQDHPNAVTFLNGDMCESAIRTSKGEIFKQVGTPQDQRDQIIDWFYPIRRQVLGVTTGNHELRIYNETGIDISKDIAAALGVPYRYSGMMLKISFGDGNKGVKGKPYVYWIYFTHGYGGARTKSAKSVKVERLGTWLHADAYCMSHDHVVNAAPDVYLMPDPRATKTITLANKTGEETTYNTGKVIAHRKMLVKTNAFLKWGGYSEMGGFPPVDLETPIITLAGTGKPRVRVTI